MLEFIRITLRVLDFAITLPYRLLRGGYHLILRLVDRGSLIIRLFLAGMLGVFFLVYVVAGVIGVVGQAWWGSELQYFDERSNGTAIEDVNGEYVGIFDPRLDSKNDLNTTGDVIALDDYTAFPDHKTLHVAKAPEHFWKCLKYHEDRNLGTLLNPFGIDLKGVIRIPFANTPYVSGWLGLRHGAGGSTISMQLARSYYNSLPSSRETTVDKIKRKLAEWGLAPVIMRKLKGNGDYEPLKRWAADHLPLAQRAAGDLHGVELTARVVFGKPSKQLSIAEQYILAAAVNKPIIVLPGSQKLNKRRIKDWRFISEVRAKKCAEVLRADKPDRLAVLSELAQLAAKPPVPQLRPENLDDLPFDPVMARRAGVNPIIRANKYLPAARYGARAQMKNIYGRDWRNYVRKVTLTINPADNLRLRENLLKQLGKLQSRYRRRISPDYTLDAAAAANGQAGSRKVADIIVAAANQKGEIVRYYESSANAHYFGSSNARERETDRYDQEREGRAIASIAKMLAAILIANENKDTLNSKYLDSAAPATGLEECKRNGKLRRLRRAEVVFGCSLSNPVGNRIFKFGQGPVKRLIQRLGFNMPYSTGPQDATPATTAVAKGLITGSPRKVHQLAGIILAALTGRGNQPVSLPVLVSDFKHGAKSYEGETYDGATSDITPATLIAEDGHGLLKDLLSAPLCYQRGKTRIGTLKSLSDWCAARHPKVRLHFAKTGTQTTLDADITVDTWVAGGLQFDNGQAFSYVVLVGTGQNDSPLGRKVHASQLAAPLLRVLLNDLAKNYGTITGPKPRVSKPDRPRELSAATRHEKRTQ